MNDNVLPLQPVITARGELCWQVPVERLRRHCNPFESRVWRNMDKPLGRREISDCIDSGDLAQDRMACLQGMPDRRYHRARVAWLAVRGWDCPIEIDVGVPIVGCHNDWIVTDGNHRLAAAIYRGDDSILSSLGGQLDYAHELGLIPDDWERVTDEFQSMTEDA